MDKIFFFSLKSRQEEIRCLDDRVVDVFVFGSFKEDLEFTPVNKIPSLMYNSYLIFLYIGKKQLVVYISKFKSM